MNERGKGAGDSGGAAPGGTAAGAQDPAELSRQMAEQLAEIGEKSRRLVADFLARQGPGNGEDAIGMSNPMAIGAAFLEMTARMMADPARFAQAQASLWQD